MDIALLLASPTETSALLRNVKEDNDLKAYISILQKQKEYRRRSLDLDIKAMRNRAQRSGERLRRCQTATSASSRPTTNMNTSRESSSPSPLFHGVGSPRLMKKASSQKETRASVNRGDNICDGFNCDCVGGSNLNEIIDIGSQRRQGSEHNGSPSGIERDSFESNLDECMQRPISSFHTSIWHAQRGISEYRTRVADSKNRNAFSKTKFKTYFSQPTQASSNVNDQPSVSRNSQRNDEKSAKRKFGLSQSFNVKLLQGGDMQCSSPQKRTNAESSHSINQNISAPASSNDKPTTTPKNRSISVPLFKQPNHEEHHKSLRYKPNAIAKYICQKGPLITPKLESLRENKTEKRTEQTNIIEETRAGNIPRTNLDVLKRKQIAKQETPRCISSWQAPAFKYSNARNCGCYQLGPAFKDNLAGNAQQALANRYDKSPLDVALHTKMTISDKQDTKNDGLNQHIPDAVMGGARTACCQGKKDAKELRIERISQPDKKKKDMAKKSSNEIRIVVDDSDCVSQTVAKYSKQRRHSSGNEEREEPRRRSHFHVSKTMWAKVEIESAEQRKLEVEARIKNEARMLVASEYEKIKHCRYIRLPKHLAKEEEGSGMLSLMT